MKLTHNEIDAISIALHESIQFYDEHGQPANHKVLLQVEDVLRDKFLDAAEKDAGQGEGET